MGVTGFAMASTPDGETPAVETVCATYEGTVAGAFGLCNAYCEAMDCGYEYVRASNTACQKVNDNFEKRYGMRLPEEDGGYDDQGNPVDSCENGGGRPG